MWNFKEIELTYNESRGIRITDLLDLPQTVPTVANWIHEEWAGLSGRTYEQTLSRFQDGIKRDHLPVTLIASQEGDPLGVATLREKDAIDWYPEGIPWICNVYVRKDARGKKIASLLCKALEKVAEELRFSVVYLTTEYEYSLYHRIGYVTFNVLEKHGRPFYVTKHILNK